MPVRWSADDEAAVEEANKLWERAKDIEGTLAERYLREHRGITIPMPRSIRFLRYAGNGLLCPAMIVVMRDDAEQLCAVQLTYLDDTGTKLPLGRRTFGRMQSGAVKLLPPRDGIVGLAKGTETALSVIQLFDIPCWAVLGAGRFRQVQMPKGVEHVRIFADNDERGLQAARLAALTYQLNGLKADIRYPKQPGLDFNDYCHGGAHEKAGSTL